MVIAIDFDGTCVTHDFPRVGKEIGAVPVLKKLVKAGHKLILFTMRSNHDELVHHGSPEFPDEKGDLYLNLATDWFDRNGIPLHGVNVNPTQSSWTKSPKAYADLYIDDAALGCPLIVDSRISDRPFVDWHEVERMLIEQGVLYEM